MKQKKFQQLRRFTLIAAMLLFPVTIWYFSPYLIIMAAVQHIINGSCIVFALLFTLSIFFGRLWCGWFCPTGGMSECFAQFSPKEPVQGWRNYIKYGIWALWLCGVAASWLLGKGKLSVRPFFMTDHGISIANIYSYVIYYGIVLLFLIPAVVHGKRATCHYICWMAPFMVLGSRAGRALRLPQLHIRVKKDAAACTGCGNCRRHCPMAVDIPAQVKTGGSIRSAECILCGECTAACPAGLLAYSMAGRNSRDSGADNDKR